MNRQQRTEITKIKIEKAINHLIENFTFGEARKFNNKQFHTHFQISGSFITVLKKLNYITFPKAGYLSLTDKIFDLTLDEIRNQINLYAASCSKTKAQPNPKPKKTKNIKRSKDKSMPVSVFNYMNSIANNEWKPISEHEFNMIENEEDPAIRTKSDFYSASVKMLLILESHFRFKEFRKELDGEEKELLKGIQLCLKSY
jgi:hypothetical protein